MIPATFTLFALAIKSGLVLAVGFAAAALAARAPAALRHRLWSLVMLSLLLLPIAQALLPALPLRWLPSQGGGLHAGTSVVSTMPAVAQVAPAAPDPGPLQSFRPRSIEPPGPNLWILALWLVGAIVPMVRLAADAMQFRRLARASKCAAALADDAAEIARRIGLRRAATVRIAPAVSVPEAGGIFRPVVLVPPAFAVWPAERRRLVLAHELEHLRRADPLWLWVARLAQSVYWWNPLLVAAGRRQALAAEQACDDKAVAIASADGLEPCDYVGHLLEVARSLIGAARASLVTAAMARSPHLEDRVRAILDADRPRSIRGSILAIFAVLAFAGFLPLAATRLASSPPGQNPPPPPAFAAASIKSLGQADGVHVHRNSDPGHMTFSGTLHDFIVQAYGIENASQLTGEPQWFHTDYYAISAVTGHAASDDQQMLMLRTLLADRFQLKLRPENREFETWNLTVAPGGPKFKALAADAPEPQDPDEPDGMFVRAFDSVADLVTVLNSRYGGRIQLDRPVVNKTGLTGRYDIVFRTAIVVTNPGTAQRAFATPDLMRDIQSELGLRLVSGRTPIASYAIVAATHPTTD